MLPKKMKAPTPASKKSKENDIDLKALALDIHKGLVFGSWSLPKEDPTIIKMVFMVLALGDDKLFDSLKKHEVVHVYEYMSKAGPRSINGYPMFLSMHMITKGQWQKLIPLLQELQKQEEQFLGKKEQKNSPP